MFCTQQANACTQKANALFWKISQVSCQLWDFQRRTYMPILPFLMEGIQSTMQAYAENVLGKSKDLDSFNDQ